MESESNTSCTASRIDWNAIDDEQVLNLNTYDFLDYLGKKVINPGGLEGRNLILSSLDIKPGAQILEIGSGNGEAACYIGEHYDCQVVSIDISDHLVKKANTLIIERGLQHKVKSKQGDITQLNFPNNSFDYVISQGVIMLVDQKKAFNEIMRLLKPGGYYAGLEFCWKKTPPTNIETETYNIFGCYSLKFYSQPGWYKSFKSCGFNRINIIERPFNLFSIPGFIRDEGIINSLRLVIKVLSKRSINLRMVQIWNHFSKNIEYINYMVYSCRKPMP